MENNDENSDENSDDNSGENIMRISRIGVLFEYLFKECISNLLTSSRKLLNFRGIPPDILDRLLLETFHENKSLKLCKLIKLSSSISQSESSLITVSSGLSNVNAGEVLIAKLPELPFSMNDLKTGYETIKKIKCCFDIDNVRIIKEVQRGVSIVEISQASESSDRNILINHFAIGKSGGIHAIRSRFCDGCRKNQCIRCFPNYRCKHCQKRKCRICAYKCCCCRDWICEDFSYFCDGCRENCCENSYFCDGCRENCCENCFAPNVGIYGVCENCNDDDVIDVDMMMMMFTHDELMMMMDDG